jgi:hypothetical protein
MKDLNEKLGNILDEFQTFESSKSESIDKIIALYNSDCTCTTEETTGWTTWKCCHSCGRKRWFLSNENINT